MDKLSLKTDDDTSTPLFCCGEEKDEGLIEYGERANCPSGEVFHYSCVGIDPDDLPDNWYCSEECKNRNSFNSYCHCHKDLGIDEPMVGCEAGKKWLGTEWYHMKCVGMSADAPPTGAWYCQSACRKALSTKGKGKANKKPDPPNACDLTYNYSKAITLVGLNLLCRRDTVREADGNAIISHWKLDLVIFFARKHPSTLFLHTVCWLR